jgi:hypothetical protein
MSNAIGEIDTALSNAILALSAAQAVLRKSLPGRSLDVLSKATLDYVGTVPKVAVEPVQVVEPVAKSSADPFAVVDRLIAEAEKTMESLKAPK